MTKREREQLATLFRQILEALESVEFAIRNNHPESLSHDTYRLRTEVDMWENEFVEEGSGNE